MNSNFNASFPSYLVFRANPADETDQCKSVVRIAKKYMRQLNIQEGDVVRLEGNTKNTAAVWPCT